MMRFRIGGTEHQALAANNHVMYDTKTDAAGCRRIGCASIPDVSVMQNNVSQSAGV